MVQSTRKLGASNYISASDDVDKNREETRV